MPQLTRNPKDSLPRLNAAPHAEVGARSQDVAERVALLQDPGHEATRISAVTDISMTTLLL